MVMDESGAVKARHDYFPWGEELLTASRTGALGYQANDGVSQKFTSKERDAETGLDYFGARYMSSAQGRFTSPDSPLGDQNPEYPQSWNLYSYVRNNPLKFFDPTGEDCIYTSNQTDSSITATIERGDCTQKGGTFVNGTIDANSLKYNGTSLDFGYTDPNGGVGTFSKGLPEAQTPGMLALREAGNRAGRDLSTSAILMAGTATAIAGTYAAPIAMEAISALRAAQLAAALKASQEAWKAMPMEQGAP